MAPALSQPLLLFCQAILLGMAAALLYDLLRAFRLRLPRLTSALDILYCMAAGLAVFLFIDADKLNGEIHYRKWQPGDTFIPFGMKGKKKISDYLTDHKFSISQKERQWVLCCGEHIAWLIGERTDNRFRIDETTKRVVIYKIV